MLQLRKNQAAFTLIELLVVVIIVSVLAAVGVPLLSANVDRAKGSEAEAALGTIRTAMRAEYAENNNKYPAVNTTPNNAAIGIAATDLNGRFFVTAAFNVRSPRVAGAGSGTDQTFCAGVDGNVNNAAPKPAISVKRSMDENGGIFESTDCSGVAIN